MPVTPDTPLIAVLENPAAKKALLRFLPSLADSPVTDVLAQMPLRMVVEHNATSLQSDPASLEFWSNLAEIDSSWTPPVKGPPIEPDPDYEGPSVPVGSAQMTYPEQSPCWDVFELTIGGPADHANPFVDVELSGGVQQRRRRGTGWGASTTATGAIPDPGSCPMSRTATGRSERESNARSLDALEEGSFHSTPGTRRAFMVPFMSANRFHFAYADGTRFTPTRHHGLRLDAPGRANWRSETLRTLADESRSTRCGCALLPKSYLFNANEPDSSTPFLVPSRRAGTPRASTSATSSGTWRQGISQLR